MNSVARWLLGAIAAGMIVWLGVEISWHIRHPCLRYVQERTTCGGGLWCQMYVNADPGQGCAMWTQEPEYPCDIQICVEREP